MKNKLTILAEEEDFLIVDKPAGMLSIPDRYDPDKPHLLNSRLLAPRDLLIVHRLDKFSSGVMILAKNPTSHASFSELFATRKIAKTYHALVDGSPQRERWTATHAIGRDPHTPGRMKVDRRGKASHTEFVLLENYGIASLVSASPVTGRTHQIRVHLQHDGHPLIVDPQYGKRKELLLSEYKRKYRRSGEAIERPILSRTPLHAAQISFAYKGKQYSYESPLPKDMRAVIHQLKKLTS